MHKKSGFLLTPSSFSFLTLFAFLHWISSIHDVTSQKGFTFLDTGFCQTLTRQTKKASPFLTLSFALDATNGFCQTLTRQTKRFRLFNASFCQTLTRLTEEFRLFDASFCLQNVNFDVTNRRSFIFF